MPHFSGRSAAAVLAACAAATAARAELKINEVFYRVDSNQETRQFIELYNAGATNCYLDGLVISDEASTGNEGIFRFPGAGTQHPVPPGGYVVIVPDADGTVPGANWECYRGVPDYDNPAVSNLTLVGGTNDLSLYVFGDNVILATGADIAAPISAGTIIDGMNYDNGGGELAGLSSSASDTDPVVSTPLDFSLCRCPNGSDNNISSASDFQTLPPTPGLTNDCNVVAAVSISDAEAVEGDAGAVALVFDVTLSKPVGSVVTVEYVTSNATAQSGADYEAAAGRVTFAASDVAESITIYAYGDTAPEGDEVFHVYLSFPTNAALADFLGIGRILDDDGFIIADIDRIASGIQPAFDTVSGRTYLVQWSPGLAAAPVVWSNLVEIVATGSVATVTDTNVLPFNVNRCYRVIKLD